MRSDLDRIRERRIERETRRELADASRAERSRRRDPRPSEDLEGFEPHWGWARAHLGGQFVQCTEPVERRERTPR